MRQAKDGTAAWRYVCAASNLAIHVTSDGDREGRSLGIRAMLLLSYGRIGVQRAGEVTVGRHGA